MNNQRKNIPKKGAKPVPQQLREHQSPVSGGQSEKPLNSQFSLLNNDIFLLAVISVITFICFHYSLHNQFLNWDDGIYVVSDSYIKSLTSSHIFSILFQDITLNYYHPLTMLTFALNYQLSGMDPWGYYLTAILIHIANVVMIFYFTRALMKSMAEKGYKVIKSIPWLIAVLALWHGIHPMHVESVSWISERKDVMYSFFYFLGLMCYLKYLKGEKMNWMLYVNIVLTLFCIWGIIGLSGFSIHFNIKSQAFTLPAYVLLSFFLLIFGGGAVAALAFKNIRLELFYVFEIFLFSLLSKPMAVSFPLSLIAIDFLMERDTKYISQGKGLIYNEVKALFHLFIEKWMFLVTAVLSGLQSIILEIGHDTVVLTHGYNLFQKLLISCYAFTMYSFRFFYPLNLCSYYPFPGVTSAHYLNSSIFYWSPLFAASFVAIPLYLTYRYSRVNFRVTLFCLLFYFSNVVFILQFLSAGTTITSDRYSYVSYFGLFFFFIYFAHWFWQSPSPRKRGLGMSNHVIIQGSIAVVTCAMGYLCYERTKVWHDPRSLWSDVIAKSNRQSQLPYLNLGDWYVNKKQYDSAFPYYKTLAELNTDEPGVLRNLGKIYAMHQQYDTSLYYINKSIKLDSASFEAYDDRAVTYSIMGKLDLAIKDYNKAFSYDSLDDGVWVQRGFALFQLGRYEQSIKDYNRLIKKRPEESEYYFERGNCELNLSEINPAIADYLKTLSINPKNANCMYNLSMAYKQVADYRNALGYAQQAKASGANVPDDYIAKLQKSASR